MRISVYFLLVLSSFAATAQTVPVAFVGGSWPQVQARARVENRNVFLYAWSPSCGPCVGMARDVFPDSAVVRYYNATFLSYKVNIDEGAGPDLARRYGIVALPAYLYLDSKGKLLHRSGGGKPAAAFIQDGKDAFDPDKAYFTLKERYRAGDRRPAFLYAFSEAPGLGQEPELHGRVVADYLRSQTLAELAASRNLEYIFRQDTKFDSPAIQYFLRHQPAFELLFGPAAVAKKTRGIVGQAASDLGRKNDGPGLNILRQALAALLPAGVVQWQALARVQFLLGQSPRDWPAFAAATLTYGQQFAAQDSFTLYEAGVYLTAFTDDRAVLATGDKIMQLALAVDKSYLNLLAHAKLLHKLKAEAPAAVAAREAIAVATQAGTSSEEATALLAEITR